MAGKQPPRAQRFLRLRDLILQHTDRMVDAKPLGRQLRCGPFLIHYFWPGVISPGANLQIWPAGKQDSGHIVQGDKVANVYWGQNDNVTIVTYHSGDWEEELALLLIDQGNVSFFG